jgi:hypothetical protein
MEFSCVMLTLNFTMSRVQNETSHTKKEKKNPKIKKLIYSNYIIIESNNLKVIYTEHIISKTLLCISASKTRHCACVAYSSTAKMEAVRSFEISVTSIRLQGVTSHETVLFKAIQTDICDLLNK